MNSERFCDRISKPLGPATRTSLRDTRERLLERFLRYVAIDTTACEAANHYPSSPGQLELGRMLAAELRAMGIADAQQDAHGIVLATLPSTIRARDHASPQPPTVAFCAHLDTSPETSGTNVRPQVIRSYAGGDLPLPGDGDRVLRAVENPELAALHGCTLITSDGTTLLGADDKSGVAAIMEAAAWLMEHPEIPHGPLRLVFTCDEEIGRGVDKLGLSAIGALVCYTLDGPGHDEIDVETFSADAAVITVHGVNIHPSIGKGRMVNALRAAADFLGRLPFAGLAPETTDGRQGFLHPYAIEGGVGQVRLRLLLRDFEAANLKRQAELLHRLAADTNEAFPGARIEIEIKRQYRNMAEGLAREPRAVALAEHALRALGHEPRRTIVRGGTDGSRLTELGLPTPNLSCGEHNAHAALEWTCLEEMVAAAEWMVAIARQWAGEA